MIAILESMNEKNRNLLSNISFNFLFKIIGLLLSYTTIPLLIDYLDVELYGIWETIISILAWTNMMDIGIGNGLRNKLAVSFARKDYKEANEYISTAYVALGFIVFLFLILGYIVIPLLDWNLIFNTPSLSSSYLKSLMLIVYSFYMINFVFSLVNSIYYSVQEASIPAKRVLYQNILFFIFILIMRRSTSGGLILLAFVYQFSMFISYIILTFKFFSKYKYLKFNFKYFKMEKIKSILNVGIKFLVLQVSTMIIFTTDNMIITNVLGPTNVTTYSVTQKLFSIITTGFALLLTPLWSAFTEAYEINDYVWIKKIIKNLNLTLLLIMLASFMMVILFNPLMSLWLGNDIIVPTLLIFMNALYVIISSWNNIYAYFLNGVGALNLSLWLGLIGSIINIPISIYFSKNLGFGLAGILMGTLISLAPSTIFQPIQCYILLNKNTEFTNRWMKYFMN